MEIRSLEHTNLEVIVECIGKSFRNYFVKIPLEVDFWRKRYHAARVDYSLSFGAFDGDLLTGFIIHGIDEHENKLTAFNTGTGVLEEYRGKKIVDQIYHHAFPILKARKVEKCMLEVIEQNHVAIRVYERIGFRKDRFLRCFHGELGDIDPEISVREVSFSSLENSIQEYQRFYSWDHSKRAIEKGGELFKTYIVVNDASIELGYFVINTVNKAFIQIESFEASHWSSVLHATKKVNRAFRINNIDDRNKDCINTLLASGIKNHINQYEMQMPL